MVGNQAPLDLLEEGGELACDAPEKMDLVERIRRRQDCEVATLTEARLSTRWEPIRYAAAG